MRFARGDAGGPARGDGGTAALDQCGADVGRYAVTVGNIALSFHRAAAVTRRILEAHGHRVNSVEAPHEQMFRLQEDGDVDVLFSAWLPSSHDTYLSHYRDQVRVLTPTTGRTTCGRSRRTCRPKRCERSPTSRGAVSGGK
ncbi:glycine betaine ABC transporter substrate-binding protein [Streptomyces sp. NPDC014676]|uniref:glycine betaine ABC transporter substrate-binding protein n=1 Tax=Streptomyces sp. NPDC014676 TaxID=3364879 RepID=UPI0036FE5ACE